VIRAVLDTHDWDDVQRLFPDLDPSQWDDPPANTDTEEIKRRTIEHMTDNGYTRASAELASREVMREVSYQWD
jgi:non-specific serine/threonine protein kinase